MLTAFPIVAVSYCWASVQHPDPDGHQLRTLGTIVGQWLRWQPPREDWDIAVFIDWCSLHQGPLLENAPFNRCLSCINLLYAHHETHVWMLTQAPRNTQRYEERGWPTFERTISHMIKPGSKLLDLGFFDGRCKDWPRTTEVCKAKRIPPVVPEAFSKELHRKTFSHLVDQALIDARYKETFEDLMGTVERLKFPGLGWGDEEIHKLAESIPRCWCLLELDLRENRIGDDGAEKLAAVIAHCQRLEVLDLCSNIIGDHGVRRLADALPRCAALRALDLSMNSIGDEGTAALAATMSRSRHFETLVLSANEIGDSGAIKLAAAIPDCAKLQLLDLSENDISDSGTTGLAAALRCSRLRSLDLARNRFGDSGAEQLAAALAGQAADRPGAPPPARALLRLLDVSGNRLSERGEQRLREVWSQVGRPESQLACSRSQEALLPLNQVLP